MPAPIHKGLPILHKGPKRGYPTILPHIGDHAPLPKAYLPTPTPHYLPKPKPYHPTPIPKYGGKHYGYKLTPKPYHSPLKAVHLKPAVYKPKPDPYAAKVGGYIG